jgi:hypothetical protein
VDDAETKDRVDDYIFTSPFIKTEHYRRRRQNEQPQSNYMMLYAMDYVFRIKTRPIFEEEGETFIFDFFILDDLKFDEFFLYENVWRETLLLNKFYKDHLASVE